MASASLAAHVLATTASDVQRQVGLHEVLEALHHLVQGTFRFLLFGQLALEVLNLHLRAVGLGLDVLEIGLVSRAGSPVIIGEGIQDGWMASIRKMFPAVLL
jgi:hypothetical protein